MQIRIGPFALYIEKWFYSEKGAFAAFSGNINSQIRKNDIISFLDCDDLEALVISMRSFFLE